MAIWTADELRKNMYRCMNEIYAWYRFDSWDRYQLSKNCPWSKSWSSGPKSIYKYSSYELKEYAELYNWDLEKYDFSYESAKKHGGFYVYTDVWESSKKYINLANILLKDKLCPEIDTSNIEDILNMDLSNSKVRMAIQLGIIKASGVTFIMGPGGCGKSLIYKAIAHCVPRTLCLAPTSIAALNLTANGWGYGTWYDREPVTIHSGLGLPPHDYYYPEESDKIKEKLKTNWRNDVSNYELILVDEVSMVSPNMLDLLIKAAGEKRIPIFLFGDPMQLRPVKKELDKDKSNANSVLLQNSYPGWNFFDSYYWMMLQKTGAARTIVLDSIYRQSDPGFKSLLNRARINEMTDDDWALLETRTVSEPPEDSLILCKRNDEVNKINAVKSGKAIMQLHLDAETKNGLSKQIQTEISKRFRVIDGDMTETEKKLVHAVKMLEPFDAPKEGDKEVFTAEKIKGSGGEKLQRDNVGFSQKIVLSPGDRVMITKNTKACWCNKAFFAAETENAVNMWVDTTKRKNVANGMLGWYVGAFNVYTNMFLLIVLDTGDIICLSREEFTSETINNTGRYETTASAEQFPVKIAYAITYHKAQGLTLDKVHMVLDGDKPSSWKVTGLGYLGLSRCRTLEGLTIQGLGKGEFVEDEDSKKFIEHSAKVSW